MNTLFFTRILHPGREENSVSLHVKDIVASSDDVLFRPDLGRVSDTQLPEGRAFSCCFKERIYEWNKISRSS